MPINADNHCGAKTPYETRDEAQNVMRSLIKRKPKAGSKKRKFQAYKCQYCDNFHIGTKNDRKRRSL